MNQVIVNIIVAVLGIAIGFIVCTKVVGEGLYKKFFAGTMNVAIDPDTNEAYMSLGLDKTPQEIMAKQKFVLLYINRIQMDDPQNKQTT